MEIVKLMKIVVALLLVLYIGVYDVIVMKA
jgi:hypothetical protein